MVSGVKQGPSTQSRSVVAALGVCLYALLIALSPAFHHDIDCHVKAPSHCDACAAGRIPSVVDNATGSSFATLRAIAVVHEIEPSIPCSRPRHHILGRAPPVTFLA